MRRILAFLVVAVFFAVGAPASAQQTGAAQELIEKARLTAQKVLSEPDFESARAYLKRSSGILIVPNLLKAGFLVGGEGGGAVLLARGSDGSWSYPAFYTLGAGSIGLQMGFQSSELVFIIMSEKALVALIDNKVKLGADVAMAVGPIGRNLEAATTTNLKADMYSYGFSAGLFGGAGVEGSVLSARTEWNRFYYGDQATVRGILSSQVTNAAADELRTTLARFSQ